MISGDGERVAGGGRGGDGVPLFPKGNGLGRLDINSSNKFRPVALLGKVLKADLSDGIRCLGGGWLGGEGARLLGRAAGRLGLLLRLGGVGARLLGRAVSLRAILPHETPNQNIHLTSGKKAGDRSAAHRCGPVEE